MLSIAILKTYENEDQIQEQNLKHQRMCSLW